MNHDYADIRERIKLPPVWWDEHAVPRYCAFTPRDLANIYAVEACLLRIECQGCGMEFDVAMSWDHGDQVRKIVPLATHVRGATIHYGDPPNVGCCPAGPTMNSTPRRVLEFWSHASGEWKRMTEYEIELPEEDT